MIIKQFYKIKINLISQLMQMQPISHSQPNPQHSSNNNTQTSSRVLFAQFCTNCDSHLFTIRHDEQKYLHYYEQIKAFLEQHGVIVRKKPVPKDLYKKSPYCPPNVFYKHNGQIVYFPQIGSFQLYLNETKLFSKLQSNKWPNSTHILELIKAQENLKNQQNQNLQRQNTAIQKKDNNKVQQQTKKAQETNKKPIYRLKKATLQSARYSLDKRNLLNHSGSRKSSIKSHRFSHRGSIQKDPEQQKEDQILKMYSTRNKIAHQKQAKKVDISDVAHKNAKVSIYLQPIFPKTKVNLQTYQRHRIIFSQRIHRQRVSYQASKVQKGQVYTFQADRRQLNAKFNKDSSALSNIREATQQQQPKNQIVKAEKVEAKVQEIPQQQETNNQKGKNQTNQLIFSEQNLKDVQWENQKKIEKVQKSQQQLLQTNLQPASKQGNAQGLTLTKAQQKNQENNQYNQEFQQAQNPKPQNHQDKNQQPQVVNNDQKEKENEFATQQKKQVIISQAKQSGQQYEDAFQAEQAKPNEIVIESSKAEHEDKERKQPKTPQNDIHAQNLQ